MENRKPIKRSKELAHLSREHHEGLLLSWKINTGLNKAVPAERISSYVLFFFDKSLNSHFEEEELYVFPLLEPDSPLRREAEMQHKMLREIINGFRNNEELSPLLLKKFSELLSQHIRFEERVLFNMIENKVDNTVLKSIEEKLIDHIKCDLDWHDPFWLN
jgi:hemerythrin-like domain-containing protein